MSYRLVYRPEDVSVVGTVAFTIADPADEHEAAVLLRFSAASWISQGCPRELVLDMSVPVPGGSGG